VGREERHQLVVGEADLLMCVEIVIADREIGPLRRAIGRAIENIVGADQVAIDRLPQVTQVHAAERTVPVSAVALSAIQFARCRS